MSQAGKVITAGGAAGPILMLTGNTGGAVVPVAGNINVVMPTPYFDGLGVNIYGQGQVVGNASPGTLNVNPYITASVQTVDATPNVPLYILNVGPLSSLTYFALINGTHDDYTEAVNASATGGVVRAAVGAPQEIGSSVIAPDGTGGFVGDMDVILVGNALHFVVTGQVGATINWKMLLYFVWQ